VRDNLSLLQRDGAAAPHNNREFQRQKKATDNGR